MEPLKRKTKDIGKVIESAEFFPTPKELCKAALKLVPNLYTAGYVLDPGAGDGVWGDAFREFNKHSKLCGIEKRDVSFHPNNYTTWYTKDYLDFNIINRFDIIFGNPPFSIGEQFIRKGLTELEQGGYLVFLLRLAFLESQGRANGLYKEYPPKEVYVLDRRPSFYGNRKTDFTAYAIFIWQEGFKGKTSLDWLKWTYD